MLVATTMFVKTTQVIKKGKQYRCFLLTESYRDEKGIPRNKTLLNITSWGEKKIAVLKQLLKGAMLSSVADVTTQSGKAIGALHVFKKIAEEMGIVKTIGNKKISQYLLLLMIGRILTQGSRLKLLEWSQTQEIKDVLGIDPQSLTTDDLYETLDYLSNHQQEIEKRLFNIRCQQKGIMPRIYLYDVTSSYLEGEQNELAAFGYNRDKKKGKKQIVIGLLTDEKGYPIAIRVFTGNTQDPKTVHTQITKLAVSFGVKEIIFIGDKGMIKTAQIEELDAFGFHYITSITKPQIQTLLKKGILQLSLFEETLGEVEDTDEGIRYVYRRNPARAKEVQKTREEKVTRLKSIITKQNEYLSSHPKAKMEVAQKKLLDLAEKYGSFIFIGYKERTFYMTINQKLLGDERSLDGCYVIKTDCLEKDLTPEIIHKRYKDLKYVEAAFRTIKTGFLEIRPVYVRRETRTRGHVFVTMLAYLLIHEFTQRTQNIDATLTHKVDSLDKVQTVFITVSDQTIKRVPQQSSFIQSLLGACNLTLPVYL